MRRLRKILLASLGVLVLLIASIVIFFASFDWNRAKPWLTTQLASAIHRSVRIDGDLDLSWQRDPDLRGWRAWLPGPHVSIRKITIGNTDWATTPTFATLQGIEFDLAPTPLLWHTISIPSLRLITPSAAFERLADGRDNWTLESDGSDAAAAWKLDLGRIVFDQGEFTVVDRVHALDVKLQVASLQKTIPFDQLVAEQEAISRNEASRRVGASGVKKLAERASQHETQTKPSQATTQHYAFSVDVEGTFQNAPVKGSGKIGGVLALKNPDRPFPLHADVSIGDTRIAFVGTLIDPTDLDALDLRLWLSGTTLAQLYDILRIPLPDSPPYATEGHLTGRFTPHNKKLRYADFTARIGASDLGGDLVYETRPTRPLLSGKVESELLQFRDLAPLIGAGPVASGATGADKAAAGKLLPVAPFQPQRWQAMDADVSFSGDRVFRDAELPIHRLHARIVMDNGVLSLDPLTFRLAFGDIVSSLRLDGHAAPIKATMKLAAHGMQLGRFLPAAQAGDAKLGLANGELQLEAAGDSVAALLGAANGELKLVLDRGTISKALVETIGLNVPNIIVSKLFGDRQVAINCAAADFTASRGVFDARLFLIDTDIATIDVTGTVDLATEQLDLIVHPNSKSLRLLSLRSPIHVRGPLERPDVSIDKTALFVRGAGAIALGILAAPIAALLPLTAANLGSDDDNRCAPLLQQKQQAVSKSANAAKK